VTDLVAIILVNYKGVEDTLECVNSLLNVQYNNYAIIIIDNGSFDIDRLKDSLQNKANIYLFSTKENIGFAAACNIGIEFSKGLGADFVLLLNNDTIVEPDFLLPALTMVKRENTGIVIGKILFYEIPHYICFGGGHMDYLRGVGVHDGCYCQKDDPLYNIPKIVTNATGCYMLIPKEVLVEVGYMAEDYFLYYEDTDYVLRVMRAGYNILYCPESIIYHKVSASTSKRPQLFNYYYMRNKLLIVHRFFNGYQRLFVYLYIFYEIIKMFFKDKSGVKVYLRALKDYKMKIYGNSY